jgi:hypothetical protein
MSAIHFVRTACGVYLLQVENENLFRRWGFALVDDDGFTCEGGFGFGPWRVVPDDEVPDDVRERFQHVIESFSE